MFRRSWFKSLHCKLNGYFFTFICCKNCNVYLKRQKRPRDAPFFKKVVRRPFENSLVDSLGQIHQSLDGDYVKKQQTVEQRALTRPLP